MIILERPWLAVLCCTAVGMVLLRWGISPSWQIVGGLLAAFSSALLIVGPKLKLW